MSSFPTISEQIDALVAEQYNDFKGSLMAPLKEYHIDLRRRLGDGGYLEFLTISKALNPRPVYKLPEEFLNHKTQS